MGVLKSAFAHHRAWIILYTLGYCLIRCARTTNCCIFKRTTVRKLWCRTNRPKAHIHTCKETTLNTNCSLQKQFLKPWFILLITTVIYKTYFMQDYINLSICKRMSRCIWKAGNMKETEMATRSWKIRKHEKKKTLKIALPWFCLVQDRAERNFEFWYHALLH